MQIYKKIISLKNKTISFTRSEFDRHPLIKFIAVLMLITLYFLFAIKSHGVGSGILISILTWSFFVLCTPIADAGVLIDFPVRLITGIKMIYSEVIVWIIALSSSLLVFFFYPEIYKKTILLSLFEKIISTPLPYWIIIIISAVGTFLSIYIADYAFESHKLKKEHSNFLIKYKIIIFVFLIIFIIISYEFLLKELGVNIPLI